MTDNIKTWPDFVKQKLIPLMDTDDSYAKYVEAQQLAIDQYKPSNYRSKPVIKLRADWLEELQNDWTHEGPDNVWQPEVFEYTCSQVEGYLGSEGGGSDCNGVMGVKLNDEIFFFEVSGFHDSWNGGELYWRDAKRVPMPTFEAELVPSFYRYKNLGGWDLKSLERLGVDIPPLPSV